MAKPGIKRRRLIAKLLGWLLVTVLVAFGGAVFLFVAITTDSDESVASGIFMGLWGIAGLCLVPLFAYYGWLVILDLRTGPVKVRTRVSGKRHDTTGDLSGPGKTWYTLTFEGIGELDAGRRHYEKFNEGDVVIVTYWPRSRVMERCELENG